MRRSYRDTLIPPPRRLAIAPSETALEAWEWMEATEVEALPVVEGERFVGLVRRRSLLEIIRRNGRSR